MAGGKSGTERGGAGDEARTRDIQLGRLKLYQLSYSRRLTRNTLMPVAFQRGLLYIVSQQQVQAM
jgi:hypothetical protein